MARFKTVGMSPRLLPVVLEEQLVSGTVEHALHTLIDTEFDLSGLAAKFKNDKLTGSEPQFSNWRCAIPNIAIGNQQIGPCTEFGIIPAAGSMVR